MKAAVLYEIETHLKTVFIEKLTLPVKSPCFSLRDVDGEVPDRTYS